jgi:hypothetical protein
MMKLRVRNNWENYEWTLDGSFVDVKNIDTVTIEGWNYNVRAVRKNNAVYDHGHSYNTETYDLEIESEVADVTVWVSLYENPKLLAKVTNLGMVK